MRRRTGCRRPHITRPPRAARRSAIPRRRRWAAPRGRPTRTAAWARPPASSTTSRCPNSARRSPRAPSGRGSSRPATPSRWTTRCSRCRPTRWIPRSPARTTGCCSRSWLPAGETVPVGHSAGPDRREGPEGIGRPAHRLRPRPGRPPMRSPERCPVQRMVPPATGRVTGRRHRRPGSAACCCRRWFAGWRRRTGWTPPRFPAAVPAGVSGGRTWNGPLPTGAARRRRPLHPR